MRRNLIFFIACFALLDVQETRGQASDDLTVQSSAAQLEEGAVTEEGPSPEEAAEEAAEALAPTQPGQAETQAAEKFVTFKEGWQEKGYSRIYDAVDGRMIINDVAVRPYRLTRREAMRQYDNGTHDDEVPRDGVPSKVRINGTDYMGPRTAANYDELKGILFSIGTHPDGSQRFFDLKMVSLEWDGKDIPWDPDARTTTGVYRLTSLEKRMFAFIMQDSLDIMREFQNPEGKDLIPFEDRVDPPTGLGANDLQARRDSKGIEIWNNAISSGKKLTLERKMLAALAGTDIEDASWFPGGVSAIALSKLRSGVSGAPTALGLGGFGFGAGFPGGGFQAGGFPGGFGAGGVQPGGFYGGGGGLQAGAGAFIPGGIPSVPVGGYGNVLPAGGISPLGGSLGFAF